MNAAGTAPLAAVINLKLAIMEPGSACTIYEETQTGIDLTQTNCLFSVQVGTTVGDAKRTANDQGLTMPAVFATMELLIRSPQF